MTRPRTLAVVMVNPSIAKGCAVFSPCGRFRYRLERDLLNPDPDQSNDPTITRVEGFARRDGFGKVIVGNLFALVSTDIKGLTKVEDPRGPENNAHLLAMMDHADAVLFAWGPVAKVPRQWRNRWRTVAEYAEHLHVQPLCLGIAQDGHPRHPLMIRADQPMVPWMAPL